MFAQNFKNHEWENITQWNVTFTRVGNGRVGFVDVNDVALVALVVLTEDGHSGGVMEYEIYAFSLKPCNRLPVPGPEKKNKGDGKNETNHC